MAHTGKRFHAAGICDCCDAPLENEGPHTGRVSEEKMWCSEHEPWVSAAAYESLATEVVSLREALAARDQTLRVIAAHGDETACDEGCAASMKAMARAALAGAVVEGAAK